ncbi:unnamed protein product [Nezara viridula]|uniref:Uncharacterized protein n=1 Tax=Nezara viridula TaxID=85310 RepID=A0A9P0H1U2_NEZVI|nr:unnamed protein product [Nezara viridula]
MNRSVIVVALVLACTFSCNGFDGRLIGEAMERCKAALEREYEQQKQEFENKKLQETENGKIKDGKIDMNNTLELNEEKVNEISKRCSNVHGTDSKCSLTSEQVKCIMKNAKELQL